MKIKLIIQIDLLSNEINHRLWENSKIINWAYPVLPRVGEVLSFNIIDKHFKHLILGEVNQLEWIIEEVGWEFENGIFPNLIIMGQ